MRELSTRFPPPSGTPSLALRVELLELNCSSLANLLGEMIATCELPRNQEHQIWELAPMLARWKQYLSNIENPVFPEGAD